MKEVIEKEELEKIVEKFSTEENKLVFLKKYYKMLDSQSNVSKRALCSKLINAYTSCGLYNEAADLAVKEGLFWQAITIYKDYLNDFEKVIALSNKCNDDSVLRCIAISASRKGFIEKAIELYLRIAEFDNAAKVAEENGLNEKALEIYIRQGNHLGAARILSKTGRLDSAFEQLEKGGKYFEALRLAEEAKLKDKAGFYKSVLSALGGFEIGSSQGE